MNSLIMAFLLSLLGMKPGLLPLNTCYVDNEELDVSELKSEDFTKNDYVNSYSENGILWVESEITEDIADESLDYLILNPEPLYLAELYVLDSGGEWKYIGKTGDGVKLNEKSLSSWQHCFEFKGYKYRTNDYRNIKIRLKIVNVQESLVTVSLADSRQFIFISNIYTYAVAIFIGICITLIFIVIFTSFMFNSKSCLFVALLCILLLLEILSCTGIYSSYVFFMFEKHKFLYKLSYFYIIGSFACITAYLHSYNRSFFEYFPKHASKVSDYLLQFYIVLTTLGIIYFILPLSYRILNCIFLLAVFAAIAVFSMQIFFTMKYNKFARKSILLLWEIAFLIIFYEKVFMSLRFTSSATDFIKFFNREVFSSEILAFMLFSATVLMQINYRIRNKLAVLQISTDEANENIKSEKKRSYVYSNLAQMLSDPIQVLKSAYEDSKQILPQDISILLNSSLEYSSHLVYTLYMLSLYEHNPNDVNIDLVPIELQTLLNETITSEISTLRNNGCYPEFHENYTEGTFVIANKQLLATAIKFICQTVIKKVIPKTAVFISSEYENFTYIFTVHFECETLSVDKSNDILTLDNIVSIQADSMEIDYGWGILLHIVKRIMTLLNGSINLIPNANGIAIQMRLALEPYTPENYIEFLNEENQEYVPTINENPVYNQTLFIFDEDSGVRNLLAEKMSKLCRVKTYSSNISLEENIAKYKPDVIIYSISVPGDFIGDILKREKVFDDIAIFVTVKSISSKNKAALFKLGVFDVIQKPFSVNDVVLRIGSVLKNRNSYFNSVVSSINKTFRDNFFEIPFESDISEEDKELSSINYKKVSELNADAIFISARLTKKETNIAHLIIKGKSDKEIASALNIAAGTVGVHNKNIYKKLKVHGRGELIALIHNSSRNI